MKINRLVVAIGGVALLLLGAARLEASTITIQNASFEDTVIGSPYKSTSPTDVPGWTHVGAPGDALLWGVGYSDVGGSVITAGDGNQFVTMGGGYTAGSGTASWEQSLTGFVVGQTYVLDFMMASEASSPNQYFTFPAASTMTILASVGAASSSFTSTNTTGSYWQGWESKSFTFVADSTTLLLKFEYSGPYDVGLDNIRITSVPEPVTLLLLGTGLGAVAARRRLKKRA